jgi:hypothetical protein
MLDYGHIIPAVDLLLSQLTKKQVRSIPLLAASITALIDMHVNCLLWHQAAMQRLVWLPPPRGHGNQHLQSAPLAPSPTPRSTRTASLSF